MDRYQRFHQWLQANGALWEGVEVRPVCAASAPPEAPRPEYPQGEIPQPDIPPTETSGAEISEAEREDRATDRRQDGGQQAAGPHSQGLGLFSLRHSEAPKGSEGAGDPSDERILLSIPGNLIVSVPTITSDPTLGNAYKALLQEGGGEGGGDGGGQGDGEGEVGTGVNERTLVMLFLLLEMARGEDSFWAPYLALLPGEFTSPVWVAGLLGEPWTEREGAEELGETQGVERPQGVNAAGGQRVQGASGVNAKGNAGVEGEQGVTWEAALKALEGTPLYAASRAKVQQLRKSFGDVILPAMDMLLTAAGRAEAIRDVTFKAFLRVYCLFWSRALSLPIRSPVPGGATTTLEAIVPGLDFCNHTSSPRFRWETVCDPESGLSVNLLSGPGVGVRIGEQICISYGEKGNEELLFLYGFVLRNNPHNYIMVHYPPEWLEDDPCIDLKLQLLGVQGLSLRWLVPASICPGMQGHEGGNAFAVSNQEESNTLTSLQGATSECETSTEVAASGGVPCSFPTPVMDALRVLALTPQQVSACAELLQQKREQQDLDLTAEDAAEAVRLSSGALPKSDTSHSVDKSCLMLLQRVLRKRLMECEPRRDKSALKMNARSTCQASTSIFLSEEYSFYQKEEVTILNGLLNVVQAML